MAYKSLLDENDVKLVAIAKERLGRDEFARDHWSGEIYFDEGVIPGPIFQINDAGSYKLCAAGVWALTPLKISSRVPLVLRYIFAVCWSPSEFGGRVG